MNAIAWLVMIVLALLLCGVGGVFALAAYHRRWMPMKGARDEGFFTFLLEKPNGTYAPVAGETFEATHLYLNRERELESRKEDLFKVRSKILALTNEDGSAKTEIANAKEQLQVLRPLRVSLYKNRNLFLADCFIIHIMRSTISGAIYFLVQYKNLKPLDNYAGVSEKAGLQWMWEVLGLRSRKLVKCWADDVPQSVVRNLSRYSDLPTKGMWKWIRPYRGEQPTPADREPPPNMLIQAIVQEGKVSRVFNEMPMMQRQMKDTEAAVHRLHQQNLDKSNEIHDIREGMVDMGFGQVPPRREGLTTTFLIVAALLVGGASFVGFRLGAEMGGVLAAVFAIMGVGGLYSSGRLERLR